MNPSTVRDRMHNLQSMGNIALKADTHFTVVTIRNWEQYQVEAERDPTTKRQAHDTNKNKKNEKNSYDRQGPTRRNGFGGFPGVKYPGLFAFFGVPTPGRTPEEIRDAIRAEIERLKTEEVSDAELAMVNTRTRANLMRQLDSNLGLALQLGRYQARGGDWRELFRDVDQIQKVTKADVRRVANQTFVDTNRTVAMIQSTQMATARDSGGQR